MSKPLEVAVVLIVFNRPEPTKRVFDVIRSVRPKRLFVLADGPRSDRPDDIELCQRVMEICLKVDWECQVDSRFSHVNLGCRRSVVEGLSWVFGQVERAIILEDDCLPAPVFFPFCEELLDRYQNDPEVGMISGDNFLEGKWKIEDSYYFSRFCHIWGWATWRRAWTKMDLTMGDWPTLRETHWLKTITGAGPQNHYWKTMMDDSFAGSPGLNTWDVTWQYTHWKNGMRSIIPAANLVKNIGFDGQGTHTGAGDHRAEMSVGKLTFPLRHPNQTDFHHKADEWSEKRLYYGSTLAQLVFWSLRLPVSIASAKWIKKRILTLISSLPKPHG